MIHHDGGSSCTADPLHWPHASQPALQSTHGLASHPSCPPLPCLNSASLFFISRILLCWEEMVRSWVATSRLSAFCGQAAPQYRSQAGNVTGLCFL